VLRHLQWAASVLVFLPMALVVGWMVEQAPEWTILLALGLPAPTVLLHALWTPAGRGESARPTWTLDGCVLDVPPAPRPDFDEVMWPSWTATTTAATFLGWFLLGLDWVNGLGSGIEIGLAGLFIPVVAGVTLGMLLLPWWLIYGTWGALTALRTSAILRGRVLEVEGTRLTLGPDTQVTRRPARLTVEDDDVRVAIRGAPAALDVLEGLIDDVRALDGGEPDVPAALRALRSSRVAEAR
jgi:hypothetical protein